MNVARKKTRLNLPNLNVEAWIGSDRRVELETPDGEEFGGGHVEQLAFRAILNVLKTYVIEVADAVWPGRPTEKAASQRAEAALMNLEE